MTTLILQVLGNSDITSGTGLKGWETLTDSDSLQGTEKLKNKNYKKFQEGKTDFDFPLISKLLTATEGITHNNALFCFLLTDQTEWQSQRSETGQGWANVVAKDGIWWKDILATWCETHKIQHYSFPLKIEPHIQNGTADWEGMAEKVDQLFEDLIQFKGQVISFEPAENESIPIDKIIVQHSSGTPALNGALYLWGIKRKLRAANLEFVYISEEYLECKTHSGYHWQWHLKVPQIQELLKIQDFSGALQILKSHYDAESAFLSQSAASLDLEKYKKLVKDLEQLDRAVSLNLTDRPSLTGREGIIERVAIALWSEQAFRERSQWMHWYLRVAGALELVILLLVEKQGNGNYQWQDLKLLDPAQKDIAPCSVAALVYPFLTKGELDYVSHKKETHRFTITPITDGQWLNFKKFYVDNWQLEPKPKNTLGFTSIRNKLYHSLLGDRIDELLDKKTEELGSVTHAEHPAQVAIDYLNYIISLAGLTEEVQNRADTYRQLVQKIEENL